MKHKGPARHLRTALGGPGGMVTRARPAMHGLHAMGRPGAVASGGAVTYSFSYRAARVHKQLSCRLNAVGSPPVSDFSPD